VQETACLLTDPDAYAQMARAVNPYGDGRAAVRIREILLQELRPEPHN
jgi:UDP-N-acetylglucosamine 2-epimerase (non-hydrolysing)